MTTVSKSTKSTYRKFLGYVSDESRFVIPASHLTEHASAVELSLGEPNTKLVWTFQTAEADERTAWTRAMTAWHEFCGFEPYVPWEDRGGES